MKQASLFSGTILASAAICFSSDTIIPVPTDAPLSPQFIEWQTGTTNSHSRNESVHPSGLTPSPTDNTEFLKQNPVKKKSRATLPTQFDLRTKGFVSSVKDQKQTSNCWAFSTLAAIEGAALVSGFGKYDLSEKHLRNRTLFDGDHIEDGGNEDKSLAYLTRWDGPVLESQEPFDETDVTSGAFTPAFHVDQSQIYVGESAIKSAIMEQGPLYTTMCSSDDKYITGLKTTYYLFGLYQTNHAITVVGWDDKCNVTGVMALGAWLCKNSWGTKWGDDGYFWLSYEDSSAVQSALSFNSFSTPKTTSSQYYYDTLGATGTTGYGSDSAFGATSCIMKRDEVITSVGTYLKANNSIVEISFYSDRKSMNSGKSYAFSTLLGSFKDTLEEAGYYTLYNQKPFTVLKGDTIHTVIKYKTPGYIYPVPIEQAVANYSSKAIANPLETFVSNNGTSFIDASVETMPRSVSIKLNTESATPSPIHNDVHTKNVSLFTRENNQLYLALTKGSTVGYSISNSRGQIISKQKQIYSPAGTHAIQLPATAGVYVVQLAINGIVYNTLQTVR